MAAKAPISDTELDVLKALWELGPAPARAVGTALRGRRRKWAPTTLLTLLARLEEKGYVRVDRRAIPHVFRAAVTREALARRRIDALSKDLFGGASLPVLKALVGGDALTPSDVRALRALLDELERGKKGRDG